MLSRVLIDVHRESLFNLSLAQQRITDRGAMALFNAIPLCSLRTLNVRGNELTDTCCAALKTLLNSVSNLEYLDMSHNDITDNGVMMFAPALRTNHVLHALDLSHNKIDKKGMALILDNLYDNPTMQSISLRCNIHDDNSAEEFLKERLLHRLENHLTQEESNALDDHGGKDFLESNLQSVDRSQMEAFRRLSKGSIARKMVEDLTSNLGAYGKRLPSRDIRVDSPAQSNPFRRMDSGSSHSGRIHVALARSNSADMHSYSRDVKNTYQADGDSMGSESDDDSDIFDTDWSPFPGPQGRTPRGFSRSCTPDLPRIADEDEDENTESKHAVTSTALVSTGSEAFSTLFSGAPNAARNHRGKTVESHELPAKVSSPIKPAARLGHTLGIPHIGSYVGSHPIRSATQRHRDSANHLMYTRVLTPADPPGTRPYPIVQVRKTCFLFVCFRNKYT